jgi:hypothetical protein
LREARDVPAKRHDREFWERACREVRQGAKTGDVARRLGVRPRTLAWWCWRLGRKKTARRTRRAKFLPVVISGAQPIVATRLELDANGVRVRVDVGTDVRYVAALLNALRASC